MNQLILDDNSSIEPILSFYKKYNEGLEALEVVKVKVNGEKEINQQRIH